MKHKHLFFIFTLAAAFLLCVAPTCARASEFSIANNPDTTNYYDMETGFGAAFDGTNYLVAVQEAMTAKASCSVASASVTAQLVSPSGTLVGSRISVPGTTDGTGIQVAFDGTNYLLVWTDSTHIYGRFISTSGSLVGSQFTVASGTDIRLGVFQGILFDGNNYFVVWENRDPAGSDYGTLYGQFIRPVSATLLGSPIVICDAAGGQKQPALAFDGTNILVAWPDGRNYTACYTNSSNENICSQSDIYGQLVTKSSVSSAGSIQGGNFAISLSSLPRDNPISAAFDGENFFVAFTQETTLPDACSASGCQWNAYGRFVSQAGVASGSDITISDTAHNHLFPDVVWLGSKYLVTWTQDFGASTAAIEGRNFDQSGTMESEFTLFSPKSDSTVPFFAGVSPTGGVNYFAVVTWGNPGDMLCTANMDVYGAFIDGLWQSATDNGGGWEYLSPFGFFNTSGSPWIFHSTLGWLYPVGTSTDNIWFYDPQWDGTGGWWWTSSSFFPWIYSVTESGWLFYDANATGGRWFVNSSGQWATH